MGNIAANTPRWRWGEPFPIGPFIADIHSFDIPPTIAACIRNAAPNCVGIVLVDQGGSDMRAAAEQAAGARGMTVFWENRVADNG